ncbi:Wzz/FepE/Etk N-terminal domain-containing protein [Amylibacter sp.]|nr:Wzz/FepE/Etk N-terminal domain-containing protein [Amylibacter sp.]
MNNHENLGFKNEVDLKKILSTLWGGKFFIAFSIVISIFFGSSFLHISDRKFTVTYRLNSVSSDTEVSSLSRYSSLASLAGIQLPSSTGTDFHVYKQLLTSVETSERIFKDKDLIKKLFLSEWNEQFGKFTEVNSNKKIELLNSLKYFITGSQKSKYVLPNGRRLAEFISKNIQILHDSNTGILTIQSQTTKPEIIIPLILAITHETDEIMRDRYKAFSKDPLNFYKKNISSARSREHREALAQLIAKEEQKLMLASSSKYFTAKPIMKPTISMKPTSPKPRIVLALSIIFGLLFGGFFILIRSSLKGNNS